MKARLIAPLIGLTACTHPTQTNIARPASICLPSYQISRTDIPDDSTILFVMTNRSVYRNHLDTPCFGLRSDTRGFTYEPTDPGTDEICSNLVLIRLNTYQNTCQLGTFTKLDGKGRL